MLHHALDGDGEKMIGVAVGPVYIGVASRELFNWTLRLWQNNGIVAVA